MKKFGKSYRNRIKGTGSASTDRNFGSFSPGAPIKTASLRANVDRRVSTKGGGVDSPRFGLAECVCDYKSLILIRNLTCKMNCTKAAVISRQINKGNQVQTKAAKGPIRNEENIKVEI